MFWYPTAEDSDASSTEDDHNTSSTITAEQDSTGAKDDNKDDEPRIRTPSINGSNRNDHENITSSNINTSNNNQDNMAVPQGELTKKPRQQIIVSRSLNANHEGVTNIHSKRESPLDNNIIRTSSESESQSGSTQPKIEYDNEGNFIRPPTDPEVIRKAKAFEEYCEEQKRKRDYLRQFKCPAVGGSAAATAATATKNNDGLVVPLSCNSDSPSRNDDPQTTMKSSGTSMINPASMTARKQSIRLDIIHEEDVSISSPSSIGTTTTAAATTTATGNITATVSSTMGPCPSHNCSAVPESSLNLASSSSTTILVNNTAARNTDGAGKAQASSKHNGSCTTSPAKNSQKKPKQPVTTTTSANIMYASNKSFIPSPASVSKNEAPDTAVAGKSRAASKIVEVASAITTSPTTACPFTTIMDDVGTPLIMDNEDSNSSTTNHARSSSASKGNEHNNSKAFIGTTITAGGGGSAAAVTAGAAAAAANVTTAASAADGTACSSTTKPLQPRRHENSKGNNGNNGKASAGANEELCSDREKENLRAKKTLSSIRVTAAAGGMLSTSTSTSHLHTTTSATNHDAEHDPSHLSESAATSSMSFSIYKHDNDDDTSVKKAKNEKKSGKRQRLGTPSKDAKQQERTGGNNRSTEKYEVPSTAPKTNSCIDTAGVCEPSLTSTTTTICTATNGSADAAALANATAAATSKASLTTSLFPSNDFSAFTKSNSTSNSVLTTTGPVNRSAARGTDVSEKSRASSNNPDASSPATTPSIGAASPITVITGDDDKMNSKNDDIGTICTIMASSNSTTKRQQQLSKTSAGAYEELHPDHTEDHDDHDDHGDDKDGAKRTRTKHASSPAPLAKKPRAQLKAKNKLTTSTASTTATATCTIDAALDTDIDTIGDVAISTSTKSARDEKLEASTSTKRRCSAETPPTRKNPPVIQDEERKEVLCEEKSEGPSEKIINAGNESTAKKIDFDSIGDHRNKAPGSDALPTSTATNKHDGDNNNRNDSSAASMDGNDNERDRLIDAVDQSPGNHAPPSSFLNRHGSAEIKNNNGMTSSVLLLPTGEEGTAPIKHTNEGGDEAGRRPFGDVASSDTTTHLVTTTTTKGKRKSSSTGCGSNNSDDFAEINCSSKPPANIDTQRAELRDTTNNNDIASSSGKSNTTSSKNETSAPAAADKNSNNDEDDDYIIDGGDFDDFSDGAEDTEKEKKDFSGTSDRDPTLEEVGIFERQSKDTNGGSTKADAVTDLEESEGIEENKNVDHGGNNDVLSSAANLRHNNHKDADNVDRSVLVDGNGEKLCDTGADKDNLPVVTRTLDKKEYISKSSTSIWFHYGDVDKVEFLDDHRSQKKMIDNAVGQDFLNEYARTIPQLFESVAAMGGGWTKFLRTRQFGAPSPMPPAAVAIVDACTESDTNMVVLFDQYIDGEWMWSANHPVGPDDQRSLSGEAYDDDKKNFGVLYPRSTLTLGNRLPSGTVFEWDHGTRRPPQALVSTDDSDTRTYKFTASIVSPKFSETLLTSCEFVPHDICVHHGKRDEWIVGTKDDNSFVAKDESFAENPDVLMVKGGVTIPSDRRPQVKPTFYREKTGRFHFVAVLWIPTDYFSTMLVHPPPADNAVTSMVVQNQPNLNSEGFNGVPDPLLTDPIVRSKSTTSNSNTTSAVATIQGKATCSECDWDKFRDEFSNTQLNHKSESNRTCKLCISKREIKKKTSKFRVREQFVAMQETLSGAKIVGTTTKKKSAIYGDQDCVLKGIECLLTEGGRISNINICGRVHNTEEQQVDVEYLRNNMKKNLTTDATVAEGFVKGKDWRLYLINHLGYDSRHIPSSQGGQKKPAILGIRQHSVMINLNVWPAKFTKEEAVSKKENLSHIICLLPQENGTALLIDPDGSRVELNTSEVETFKDWMQKITKPKTYGAGKERTHKESANKIFTMCISDKYKKYKCEVKAAFLISKVPARKIATHKLHDEKLLSRA